MIKAFIFDWAGTMVDFGCMVPTRAMQRAFSDAGVIVSDAQIRRDMGKAKQAHIKAILSASDIGRVWRDHHGRPWSDEDVNGLLAAMERHTRSEAVASAVPIDGALDLVTLLRQRGIKVGSTTGYTKPIMDAVVPEAARNGYTPDVMICADDVPAGRPAPFMIWHALEHLGVWPASHCVKVDDAPVGITAGHNAGMVTIGLAASGNGVGLSVEEFRALSVGDRQIRIDQSATLLRDAGADYVVETVADIPALMDNVSARIASAQ